MSKKNKVSSKKTVKKPAAGKSAIKSAKPEAKKAVKKPATKPAPSKTPKSKSPSKPSKSTAKKIKVVAKAAVKKQVIVKSKKPDNKKAAPTPKAKSGAKTSLTTVKKPIVKTGVKKVEPVTKVQVAKKPEPPAKPTKAEKPASAPTAKALKAEENSKKAALAEAKGRDVLAINNTIPVAPKHEISQSKIASISQSITNPIRRSDSYAVKVEKEPNGKFELEFVFHASAEMLYEFVSTASGLSEWFCDDLNIRNGIYTFIWEDQLQQARLLKTIDLNLVRFQWVEKTDGSYFEFKIQKDDLTNDISLIVTDFADSVSERESSKLLWNSQIEKLRHVLGSIF
jgi:uncharacterized protein YndB with AHSA1/START domain